MNRVSILNRWMVGLLVTGLLLSLAAPGGVVAMKDGGVENAALTWLGAAQPSPGQVYYKILVNQDGLYQVSYSDLQAAGVLVDSLDPRTFQLYNQGIEVAIEAPGQDDGVFNPGEYLLFYGQKINTRYTDTNVYWLTWGLGNGKRMTTSSGAPSGTAPTPSDYLTTARAEIDKIYKSELPNGAAMDHWFWDGIRSTGSPVAKDFSLSLNNLASGVPDIQVRGLFKGDSSYTRHHVQVRLNNNLINDAIFDYVADHYFEVTIPQSYLVEGLNTFNVKVMVDVGLAGDLIFINWFEIDYYDRFVAEDDWLAFDGDQAGTWEFRVDGFSSQDIAIYDITTPLEPQRISDPLVQSTGSAYQAAFEQTSTAARHYLALTTARRLSPLAIFQDVSSNLRNPGNGADWLAISHADFISALQPLVDQRAAQGYRTQVVDVQDIYDEFNGGVFNSQAIHDFLAYAYAHWTPPAPQFVLLVGDGNYDFKNLFGTSLATYIPPYLADVDPYISETAADNRYVTFSVGDTIPDMHLGRLPVRSAAETTIVVNKIITYENASEPDGWNKNISFVADNADAAGNFADLSDDIADNYLPSPYSAEKIYYGVTYPLDGGSATRQAIINAINAGRLVVSYVGHANPTWWGLEKFFQVSDIPYLTNADRLPFMVPMTCLDGYYINPSESAQSLSESLVRAQDKGAIASFAPSGKGVASGHDTLEKGLFEAIFTDKINLLGPATTQAKDYLYNTAPAHRDLIDTYLLFGDPATRLQVVPAPTAVELASFNALPMLPAGVRLEWQTISEINTAGFNIYRAQPGGSRQQINPLLIATQAPGSLEGAAYSWLDRDVVPGMRYQYWLETLDVEGRAELSPVLEVMVWYLLHLPLTQHH